MRLLLPIVVLVLGFHAAWGAELRVEDLLVETSSRQIAIRAEIADTPATRQRGLMFRESLDWQQGMLFDFGRMQPVTFWMKDTPLYLDMLFIDEAGVITGILANVEPFTTTARRSPGPVLSVLELRGGAADRLGIVTGDIVRHRIFKNTD